MKSCLLTLVVLGLSSAVLIGCVSSEDGEGAGDNTNGVNGNAGSSGKGDDPTDPTCPDANDPAVHYVGTSPKQCAAAFFACSEDQTTFDGDCGCGCIDAPSTPDPIPDPSCPDPNDSAVDYVSTDPLECAAMLFKCDEGETLFSNECGCGCIAKPATSCPDPNDPKVHYLSSEPLECAAMFYQCDAGQSNFNDQCGCGCVDP